MCIKFTDHENKFLILAGFIVILSGCKSEDQNEIFGNPNINPKTIVLNSGEQEILSNVALAQSSFEKTELFLDNRPLSNNLLIEAINNEQITNFGLEMILLTNNPIDNSVLNHLKLTRPDFKLKNIGLALNLPLASMSFFISMGTQPSIFFSNSFSVNQSVLSNCSSSYSSNGDFFTFVIENNADSPVYFARRPPCQEGNKKWFCGSIKDQEIDMVGGSVTIISTLCENSDDYCQRRIQK